ncbi:MAG TPA: M28 family peptidase [Thermomicrobiales bacterium]|nr:M28 family peptidase [Thermomicrobiales bacterium]
MSATALPAGEQGLVEAVSGDEMMGYTAAIARWVRLSGSEDEAKSFDYIEETCKGFGMAVERYAIDSLVSWPGEATLEILGDSPRRVPCITHSFAVSTDGLDGEVIYAAGSDLSGARGKIALSDGLANPGKAVAAQEAGVLAQINICDRLVHEMIITPVWGTPTTRTAPLIPQLVTVSVNEEDGAELKRLAAAGALRVRITARVDTRWRKIPTLTAELKGQEDRFVLFSGHVDSWHYGAMDNGTANATMLEVGRILGRHRGELKRGLRLAFWSGHSHGRYSASTWYADHFWPDLHEHCVAHVNVDSTGGMGAEILSEANTMAETTAFAGRGIREVAGQDLVYKRFGRAGDQSFWGVGLPSIFMSLSGQPAQGGAVEEQMGRLLGTGGRGRSGGLGWWWHTTEDTIDKIDRDNLVRDARVYVLTCWRLCTAAVLPLDYHATAEELLGTLRDLAAKAGDRFDLAPVIREAETLVERTSALNEAAGQASGASAARVNDCLMALGRWLTPVNYTLLGEFEHDLALGAQPIPSLQPVARLAALDPESDQAKFLATECVRARNRVWHALDGANKDIAATLAAIGR